jgi:hypothetical protein
LGFRFDAILHGIKPSGTSLSLCSLPVYSMFFLEKSTNTVPTALRPVSGPRLTLKSGLISYRGASWGKLPSGKHTDMGKGGFLMNLDPPGMIGRQ